jgi:hypothetical protein
LSQLQQKNLAKEGDANQIWGQLLMTGSLWEDFLRLKIDADLPSKGEEMIAGFLPAREVPGVKPTLPCTAEGCFVIYLYSSKL